MKNVILSFLVFLSCLSQAYALTPEEEGRLYGKGAVPGIGKGINTSNGQNTVPNYATNSQESTYYQDGMGAIREIGGVKVNQCANYQASSNNQLNLECEAINLVNKSAVSRPIYSIDPQKDKVIQDSQKIKKEAPLNMQDGKTCVTRTVTKNPIYEKQQCTQGQAYIEQQCIQSLVNDVCPQSIGGNQCNSDTGIDQGNMSTDGQFNGYINYSANQLKLGLGQMNTKKPVGAYEANYEITIHEASKLSGVKLLSSTYDDAYRLYINDVEVFAVNIGSKGDNLNFSSNQELSSYFKNGKNKIKLIVYNTVSNSPYRADLSFSMPMFCACTKKKINSCTDDILKNPQCGVQTEACVEQDSQGQCIKKQQNFVCRNSSVINFGDNNGTQGKMCEIQTVAQCNNPSGVVKDHSKCDEGIDFNSVNMVLNQGNASFVKSSLGFTLSDSWNDGTRGSSQRKYGVSFTIKQLLQANVVLKSVHFDNAIRVFINEKKVYENSTDHNKTVNINMNLQPYLVVGANTIRMEIDNWAGPGAGILDIATNYQCSCSINQISTCNNSYGTCQIQSETCTDQSVKNINGVMVNACWKKERKYTCQIGGTTATDCQPLVNKGCTQIDSICTSKDASGKCLSYSQTYQCEKSPSGTEQQTVCTESKCIDGKCFEETSNPDQDFAQGVVMMEATREASVYGETDISKTLKVFGGESGTCTVKLLGGHNIMSCCKEQKINLTGSSNNEVGQKKSDAMGNNPNTASQSTGGSTYQYDDIYNKDSKTLQNLQAQLTFGWLECKAEERTLGIKRGGSLCEHARTWCSSDQPIIGCVEESRRYCCFKSILAKIINREGKAQLGLSKENCDGMTIEQLQKIDFSKIDMTEFKESIVPKNLDLGNRAEQIKEKVNKQAVGGYYSE